MFELISGVKNKAADCLSCLVELPQTLSAPSMCYQFQTQMVLLSTQETKLNNSLHQILPQHNLALHLKSPAPNPKPKFLTADKLEALLQMQKTDHFCKWISKHLSNGKAPQHETDLFTHIKGLLYKHITESGRKFLALVIPKSWKYTVLVEAHDKLGHQGSTHTYCLIKCQYYWKGMNKDIRKYIANCTLCHREKAKVQKYPLQMTEIPNRPFNKIAIDLVTECETSASGNKHILTIIDHLTGWPEAFPILDKSADTIVSTFINKYLPVYMCPRYILSDNGTEFKTTSWIKSWSNWVLKGYSQHLTTHKAMANRKYSTNT